MIYPNYYTPAILPKYTLVVRDLIDIDGKYGDTPYTGELTSGYTIRQVEISLGKNWDEWKNNIINDHTNNTEQYVQNTFNYWN